MDAAEKAKQMASRLSGLLGKRPAGDMHVREVNVPEVPGVDFVGLFLGPQGSTQKSLEMDTGCRISLRGKGLNGTPSEDPLLVELQATTAETLERGVSRIQGIINDPSQQEQLKNRQNQQSSFSAAPPPPPPQTPQPPPTEDGSAPKRRRRTRFGDAPPGAITPVNTKITIRVDCPTSRVGTIIGSGGAMIRYLMNTTGTHMQLDRNSVDPTGQFKQFELVGVPDAVQTAKKLILNLLDGVNIGGPVGGDMSMGGRPGLGMMGRETLDIPNNCVGLLIGRGGDTIRQLQTETGATIQVQKDNEAAPGAGERTVNFSGEADQIAEAKRRVKELIEGSLQKSNPRGEVMHVPCDAVGLVIGRGGATIRSIQQESGCQIQVAKEDLNNGQREVTLSGPPDAVERARAMVEDCVNKNNTNNAGGGGRRRDDYGSGSGAGYGSGSGYGMMNMMGVNPYAFSQNPYNMMSYGYGPNQQPPPPPEDGGQQQQQQQQMASYPPEPMTQYPPPSADPSGGGGAYGYPYGMMMGMMPGYGQQQQQQQHDPNQPPHHPPPPPQ